jgi:hypothetical protein
MKESQMRNRRLLTIAFATSSLVAVSGIAYAVVQSIDPAPAPQVVVPASSTHSPGHRSATPEPGDDHGARGHGADDPATHDAGDDHGGATSGSDDPATHDAGDDHGGATSGSSGSGSGSDDSGSGSGSGSDDSGSGGGHGSDG